jgi:hypothetical protein
VNRRLTLFLFFFLCVNVALNLSMANLFAQDEGLNLPTELYVLENDGVVTRYGLGTAGISDVTPADAVVIDFAVAPDGSHIAYRTEQELILKEIFSDNAVSIEAETASLPPIRGQGDTLNWTSDGAMLAYTTLYGARVYFPATQLFSDIPQANVVSLVWSPDNSYLVVEAQNLDPNAHSSFWWIYHRDNTAFTLVSAIPSSVGVSWLDNARLVFAPETGGLYTMDMSAGNVQTELLDATVVYREPYVRDDGTITAFAVVDDSSTTAVPTASTGVFGRLIAIINGEQVETGGTPLDIDRVRWAPHGDLLVAFRGGALALVNPASGFAFALPLTSAVAYGWGPLPPTSAASLQLPSDGFFLSDFSTGIAQIWRLPADGSPADTFTFAEDPITEFAISPNGQQVVYVSGGKLWLQDVNPAATAAELATVTAIDNVTPTFSPGGDQIAYADSGIWLVSAAGGAPTQAIAGDYISPQFAPNVNALLVNALNEGLGVLDLAAGTVTTFADTSVGFWLSDGRIAAVDNAGIGIYDLTTLPTPSEFVSFPSGALSEEIVQPTNDASLRLVLMMPTIQPATVGEFVLGSSGINPIAEIGYIVAPQLSPDGSFVAGYRYLRTDANGITRGQLLFVNVDTNTATSLSFPSEAWGFQWGQ